MRFEFTTANRILFGPGTLEEVGTITKAMGSRALVVTGRTNKRAERLIVLLADRGVDTVVYAVVGEPTVAAVARGVARAQAEGCDVVVGFGGGSAMDAAKAIAALLTNEGELYDYLEVIGRAEPLRRPAAPCIAIPTTAGTGAEVTRNSVLASPERRVKVSLRSPFLLPRVALVDPELTYTVPPPITVATGLDALTQLIEPYVCNRANPMTDEFCLGGMRMIATSLRRVFANGADSEARRDMALASLYGGIALANAGLGAVHGLAAPIGGMFPAPHGAVCAALLPVAMEVNIRALRERQPGADALGRYRRIAEVLTGKSAAQPEDGAAWVRELCAALGVPHLRAYGVGTDVVPNLVAQASRASSMKANPVTLAPNELEDMLLQAL